jgi:hypothetical protein
MQWPFFLILLILASLYAKSFCFCPRLLSIIIPLLIYQKTIKTLETLIFYF